MKAQDAKLAARLFEALKEIPKVRKELKTGKSKYYDGYALEIQAAEMNGDESQGCNHYFDIPRELADPILDAAEKVIRGKLKALKVDL